MPFLIAMIPNLTDALAQKHDIHGENSHCDVGVRFQGGEGA